MERDKFASTGRKGDSRIRHGWACLFKQKQLIVVGESVPLVVGVLTSSGLLLYDPDPQNGALGDS